MKVAISLPDPVFEAAERLAKELEKPRSQLYADAIAAYVGNHDKSAVTDKLNAVYTDDTSSVDEALFRAQLDTLDHETW